MRRGSLLSVVLLLAVPVIAEAQQAPPLPADSTARARDFARLLLSGKADSLWPNVQQGGTGNFATQEAFSAFVQQLSSRAGTLGEVIEQRWGWRGGNRQFWHVQNLSEAPEPIVLRLIITPGGKLAGIGLQPQSAAPAMDSLGPVLPRQ